MQRYSLLDMSQNKREKKGKSTQNIDFEDQNKELYPQVTYYFKAYFMKIWNL